MTIKKEAAYHEAAHAVVAHNSRFHSIIGDVNLEQYGAGEIYISLSRPKCIAAGKPATPETAKDREVASELATILCAGLVGEEIAAERVSGISPNPECAEPDHNLAVQQLQSAGLSKKYDLHRKSAREILEREWVVVERLANYLFENINASPDEVSGVIDEA